MIKKILIVLCVFVFLIGAGVFLYPSFRTAAQKQTAQAEIHRFENAIQEYKITLGHELCHTTPLGTDLFGNILRLDNTLAALPAQLEACREQLENGLPLNRAMRDDSGAVYDAIAGTAFLCDCSGERFGSLSEEQCRRYQRQFRNPEHFVRIGSEILAIPYHPREQQKGEAR